MKLIRQSAFITSILALIIFIACKRTIGGIDRDTPPLPSGNQMISLQVATTDGSALPTYTVLVTTPDGSTNSSTSGDPEFIIDPIISGTYTIEVTTDAGGHIGQTKEIIANVPAEPSDDYVTGATFFLTTKNPAVTIDNAAGGTINVPAMGTGAGGIGSLPTTITIPPGALPGNGSTAISVTPTPSDGSTSNNGIKGVEFHFEPTPLQFTTPITIEMPLGLSQTAVNSGAEVVFQYEDGETEPVTLSSDGQMGTTQISHFSTWTVVLDMNLIITSNARSQTFSSICSEGLDESFTFSGSYGPIVSNLLQIPTQYQTVIINGTVVKEPIAYFRLSGTATAFTFGYRLETSNGNLLEQRNNIPLCSECYTTTYSSTECHDSGG
ncbi:hypothetical protein [Marinoscillum pacificum]|uniref:hypothetical protein n=1 Tax=Marinoscillum pacificum TaxID=392723 RepID=UPI002157DDC5|nr:hypothetical protein [Marinoscillum pacificum]